MNLKLIVVQPTSLCNLNCSYCYVPNRKDKTIMNYVVLENLIAKVFSSKFTDEEGVEFLWHAGEPLLAGLDFYKTAINLIQHYNEKNIPVINSIQTNGTLVTDEWCDFFKENNINIGFSLDGPDFINGKYRKKWSGKSAHSSIMKGLRKLHENGIKPGLLCVLTKDSLQYPDELFQFFLENEFHSIGFNIEEIENENTFSSLKPEGGNHDVTKEIKDLYSKFISRFFDLWFPHRQSIKLREFEDIIYIIDRKLQGIDHVRTPDELKRLGIVTIQKNGNITTYSPEFAGAKSEKYSNFIVGNIMTDNFEDILNNENFKYISSEVDKRIDSCKTSCEYFDVCGGAYISNLFFETESLIGTESSSCILHRKVLSNALIDKLNLMSKEKKLEVN